MLALILQFMISSAFLRIISVLDFVFVFVFFNLFIKLYNSLNLPLMHICMWCILFDDFGVHRLTSMINSFFFLNSTSI